jgi:hypothetical protein
MTNQMQPATTRRVACGCDDPPQSVHLWCIYDSRIVYTQVAGALAATTEYDEPDPPTPPPNATPEDTAALEAKACAATSLTVAGFRVQGVKGTVKGYSSIILPVEFTPRVAGKVVLRLKTHNVRLRHMHTCTSVMAVVLCQLCGRLSDNAAICVCQKLCTVPLLRVKRWCLLQGCRAHNAWVVCSLRQPLVC